MIPLGDNIPSRSKPIVNYLLIGFNVGIFLWEIKLALTGELANFAKSFGIMPVRITTAIADIASGNPAAMVAAVVFSGSLLSAMFLHGSSSQILGNAIFLWVFGQKVEDLLGHGRYLAFYLICGILIGVVQILV